MRKKVWKRVMAGILSAVLVLSNASIGVMNVYGSNEETVELERKDENVQDSVSIQSETQEYPEEVADILDNSKEEETESEECTVEKTEAREESPCEEEEILGTEWNDVVDSGTCGEDLIWRISGDESVGYILTISGTGTMIDYDNAYYGYSRAPWSKYSGRIKSISMSEGLTAIGEYAFDDCSSLTSVSIPNSVTSIGVVHLRSVVA